MRRLPETLEEMLLRLKGHVMSPWERRAQHISWAVGNAMVDRPDYDAIEWELRLAAAKHYDARHEVASTNELVGGPR